MLSVPRSILVACCASLLALALAGPALAGDPAAGKTKAQQNCAICHGPLGLSQNPGAPNLAGQPAIYLVEQLRAFRGGKRQHQVMSIIAKPLTDDDISDLAAWYASLVVSVQSPD